MSNETLILILFLIINILTGCCLGLLDSREFWKRKYYKEVSDENIRSTR